MGGTQSKTTVDILTDIAMKVVQKNISKCIQTATQDQEIAARNVEEYVVIEGVSQEQSMSVNMQCALSNQMQSDIQSQIATQIAQYAESKGIALLSALGRTVSSAATNIKQLFEASVEQTNIQSAVMKSLNKQKISAVNVGKYVVLRNISQKQTLTMTASAIITSTGYAQTISDIAETMDQATDAEETGPLDTLFNAITSTVAMWVFMVIGIVLVGGLVVIFFMKYLFTTDTGAALVKSGTEMAQSQLGSMSGAGMICDS
jgi:lysine/ornithine N-monooxygenase